MPKPIEITQSQARRFLLAHQALWPPRSLQGKAAALATIRRLGCIQYDPLNMAGRNAELVLQARLVDFRPALLTELLYQDRRLLDGFDKVMSIYCVEDWPYFQRRRERDRQLIEQRSDGLLAILPLARQAVEERGPLCSLDLDFEHRVDWPWGPTRVSRAALESQYLVGELVVHHKVNTRKYYDLAQRHIAPNIMQSADPNPTIEEYQEWHVLRRVGGVGLLWNRSGEAWLGLLDTQAPERTQAIKRLLADGRLTEARVEGIPVPLYLCSQDMPVLEQVRDSEALPAQAAFIAPLDNLLWDRRIIETMFNFQYRWEVYTPPAKRKYSYYVLPVLYGDRFIARVEPVFEKRTRNLALKNWWWEPGIVPDEPLMAALAECFKCFAAFLNAKSIQLGDTLVEPDGMAQLVAALCRASC